MLFRSMKKQKVRVEFIGRDQQLSKLESLDSKHVSNLVVIKGRRRVGKTRLIDEFCKNRTALRFAGLAPTENIDAQVQRNAFARQLHEQTGLPGIETTDWSHLFGLLAERVQNDPIVIVFDEITWMASGDATFLSKLQNAWEMYFKQNPNLILILCGSISA